MDMNILVDDIMSELGLKSDFMYTSMTPFDIATFIEEKCLRTWNNFMKWYHPMIVDFEESDIVRSSGDTAQHMMGYKMYAGDITYRIPQAIRDLLDSGLELYNVSDVELFMGQNSSSILMSNYTNFTPVSLFNMSIPKTAYNLSSLNAAMPTIRAKYEAPDKIVIINGYNLPKNTRYQMTLGLRHTANLKTINHGEYEMFKELCRLELMCYIYDNELKFLDGINTGNASVELKLDMFETCHADLQDYKEKLRNNIAIDTAKNLIKRF